MKAAIDKKTRRLLTMMGRPLDELAASTVLTFKVVLLSFVGLVPVVFHLTAWWSGNYFQLWHDDLFHVDYRRNETVVRKEYSERESLNLRLAAVMLELSFQFFAPLTLVSLGKLNWKDARFVLGCSGVGYVIYFVVMVLKVKTYGVVAYSLMLGSNVLGLIGYWMLDTRDMRVCKVGAASMVIFGLGISSIPFLDVYPQKGDWEQFLYLSVILPILREIFNTSSRLTVLFWIPTFGLDLQFALVGWTQIMTSIYVRMHFAKIVNRNLITILVIMQSVNEFILRATVRSRYRRYQQCYNKCNKRSSTATIQPVDAMETNLEAKPDPGPNERFYGLVLITEMTGEYIGIFSVLFLHMLNSNRVLYQPLSYYNHQENPFSQDMPLDQLFYSAFLQFISEIIIDSLCTFVEMRWAKCDVSKIFKELVKTRSTLFWMMYGSSIGFICTLGTVATKDRFDECRGIDMCYCANGHGLQSAGLRDRYCHYLYPDTNGFPGVPANVTN